MIKVQVNKEDPILIENFKDNYGSIDGKKVAIDVVRNSKNQYHVLVDGKSFLFEVQQENSTSKKLLSIVLNGKKHQIKIIEEIDELLEKMGINTENLEAVGKVKAPMPGIILEIKVKAGSQVKKGDPLLILEAMKMENIIKSPTEGIIGSVSVIPGERVEKNSLLVEFQNSEKIK